MQRWSTNHWIYCILLVLLFFSFFPFHRAVNASVVQVKIAEDTFKRRDHVYWGTASDGHTWTGDANTNTLFSISQHTGMVANQGNISFGGYMNLGPSLTDGQVSFTGYVSSFYNSNIGATARYQDDTNFYKAFLGSGINSGVNQTLGQGPYLILQKRQGGTYYVLDALPFAAQPDTEYALTFQVVGAQLRAKVWKTKDKEPSNWMVQATDTDFSSGVFGLRMLAQDGVEAHYTYFAVYTLTQATPTPTATPTPSTSTITGSVFNDTDQDGLLNNGEQPYLGAINITATGGTVTRGNGTYTISGLPPGTYTVSYTNLPSGYTMISPKNGPPPSFLVTVGLGCAVGSAPGATCSNGNVTNLNFAISNARPWIQLLDLDGRRDTGFTTTIPASANAQCGAFASTQDSAANTPGILFSGDTFYDFGQGQASQKNWVVGGPLYPEVAPQTGARLRTAYSNLLNVANRAGLPLIDLATLATCTDLANCTLPANLPDGIYHANSNVTLAGYPFPSGRNYVFLINGDLTVRGTISVPVGSTALFSTAGNILVDKGVTAAADTCPLPQGQLQGMFSADKNVIVEGVNDCRQGKDTMLNIDGAVITNAARTGGTLTTNRNLCSDNRLYPSLTIRARPDFLLNAPTFLLQQQTYSGEEAP